VGKATSALPRQVSGISRQNSSDKARETKSPPSRTKRSNPPRIAGVKLDRVESSASARGDGMR